MCDALSFAPARGQSTDTPTASRPHTHNRTQQIYAGTPMTVPTLFLDLDGTVRQGRDDALGKFVNGPEDVNVFPEAVVMMRRFKARGGRIIGISNQGGIALGVVTYERVKAAMAETQRQTGDLFDIILWCPHHPAAEGAVACSCRKPAPGLLFAATAHLAFDHHELADMDTARMVGDRPEDREAANRAGIGFQFAAEWRAQAADREETA